MLLFRFVVDIYVGFASASSNLSHLLTIVHEATENVQTYSAIFMHFAIILRFFPIFC
jgi:hypothetical protein